jgi:hypothetical protein
MLLSLRPAELVLPLLVEDDSGVCMARGVSGDDDIGEDIMLDGGALLTKVFIGGRVGG